MSTPTKQALEDAAKRNPGISPDRVREMQEVVKRLQDRSILQPPTYGLRPPLTSRRSGMPAVQHTRLMNRTTNGD
jgi:hypothetical protein